MLMIEPTRAIEPSATPLSVGVMATPVPEELLPESAPGDEPSEDRFSVEQEG